ncbi:unnamed protein product [Effrenium voratum]|uniref:Uncharacterized protein n=1 Tax=Effrenium voratum TaxID=2562239 RepID=A0AA36JQZ5_9DINO|nr:unnamed protein product [Effrenium voratum]CAJ1410160.1 unnamed protein product [Effrenium voratum]CAJ1426743.1 unnamed protein product [Effrenium voratum]
MIVYEAKAWTLLMILRIRGSVFPKGLRWAVPNAIFAALLHDLLRRFAPDHNSNGLPDFAEQMDGVEVMWSGYTFVLGFLVVFRNNQAYSRFWEGATLISQVRGEWFNAVSSLFAFASRKPEKAEKVLEFKQLLVRLASMMYCAALQQVCDTDADDSVEILDTEGIAPGHLEFLLEAHDQCEVLLQWVQQLIVESADGGVLDVPPPILSRAFQELSRGIVTLNNARKIKDIPFPFPYAQMLVCMLTVHWVVTPMLASLVVATWWWAAFMSFLVTGSFWCLMYIAIEIDQPFGADANDLPIKEMMRDYNRSLLSLLHSAAQKAPSFSSMPKSPMFVQSKEACLTFSARKRLMSYSDGALDRHSKRSLPSVFTAVPSMEVPRPSTPEESCAKPAIPEEGADCEKPGEDADSKPGDERIAIKTDQFSVPEENPPPSAQRPADSGVHKAGFPGRDQLATGATDVDATGMA